MNQTIANRETAGLKADGFKVTPEFLRAIGMDLDHWPTLHEAENAKKEADILVYMGYGLFMSNPVQWVLKALRRKYNRIDDILYQIGVFNYGYILGVRAERARRKGVK